MAHKHTGGGVGTNQYAVRGTAKQLAIPGLSVLGPIVPDADKIATLIKGEYARAINEVSDLHCPPAILLAWTNTIVGSLPDHDLSGGSRATKAAGFIATAMVNNPQCPYEAFAMMLNAKRAPVRQAALSSLYVPDDLWDYKINRHFKNVTDIRAIWANPKMADPATAWNWVQTHPEVRPTALISNHCPQELIEQILQPPYGTDRLEFIRGESCTPQLMRTLLDVDPDTTCAIASRPDCPVDILCNLATNPDSTIRSIVAGNRNTPVAQLHRLATDTDNVVRRHLVFGRTDLPLSVLQQLISDQDKDIQRHLAAHRQCDANFLRRLNSLPAMTNRNRCRIAKHRNCPSDLLVRYVGINDISLRAAAIKNPNCPAHIRTIAVLAR